MVQAELLELMEGARNCVNGYAMVQKDENVLIWTDRKVDCLGSKVDPLTVDAIALACEEEGADVTVISSREWKPRLGQQIPKPVEHAMYNSDVVFTVFALENMATVDCKYFYRYLLEHDSRNVLFLAITPDLLASRWARFPVDLYFAIMGKAASKVKDAEFHLTCPNGTDFTGRLKAYPQGRVGFADSHASAKDRRILLFPGGELADHPVSPVNGTVVFEVMEGFRGLLSKPVRLTVVDHRVTKVEGGDEARWLERMIKRTKNGDYLSEIAWGNNPTPSLSRGLMETPDSVLFRRAGTYHCAVGLWYTVGIESDIHWDGGARACTLTIGDELIIDNGRVLALDDPEIRDIASKYGDPDDVLRYEP